MPPFQVVSRRMQLLRRKDLREERAVVGDGRRVGPFAHQTQIFKLTALRAPGKFRRKTRQEWRFVSHASIHLFRRVFHLFFHLFFIDDWP
jgi:hypothetical protein